MSDATLRALLHALRDGETDPVLVARARAAVDAHPMLASLGGERALGDDLADDAAALLALLGEDDGVGEALRGALDAAEAPEVVGDVMQALFADAALPVAEAVSHEAGALPDLAATFDAHAAPVAEAVAFEAGGVPELAQGFDPAALPLAAAVASEAGRGPELAQGFDPDAIPVAEAVAFEAGDVSVVAAVLAELGLAAAETAPTPVVAEEAPEEAWLSALLDRALSDADHRAATQRLASDPAARATLTTWADTGRRLREAVQGEAGAAPDLWREVALGIGLSDPEAVPGWDETVLGEAVRAEAGTVDVAGAVLDRLTRDVRAPAPVVPEPANAPWMGMGLLVAAAAAALIVVLPGLLPTNLPAHPGELDPATRFASAEEINVDQVQYGENASVYVEVPEDDDAPIIIWVDDGGRL